MGGITVNVAVRHPRVYFQFSRKTDFPRVEGSVWGADYPGRWMGPVIPLEAAIVRRIMRRLAVEPGCYAIKTKGDEFSVRGTPDIIGSLRGRSFVLEVKRPGVGVVSESQTYQLQKWANAGALVAVVEGLEDVAEVLGL